MQAIMRGAGNQQPQPWAVGFSSYVFDTLTNPMKRTEE
jgi:hypothetical protein